MKTARGKKSTKTKPHGHSPDFLEFFTPHIIGAGYGLFTRTADHHLPRIILIERILKKYRKRNSWIFLVKWALIKAPKKKSRLPTDFLPLLYQMTNINEIELLQLAGIYKGLKEEKGAAVATAACVEITRMSKIKEEQKSKKKKKKFSGK